MARGRLDNLSDSEMAGREYCSVCRDLLANLGRFLDLLETARRSFTSDWLTVDEVAAEMRLSRSIVYRLIRNGELEAVDLVNAGGKTARKGHYRITRSSLNRFLESKKVKPLPTQVTPPFRSMRLPKVKNHLGL